MKLQAKSSLSVTDSQSSLHGGIAIAWGLCLFLLCWLALAISINWLGDFLHAPIGIKDNPPAPGIFVQLAQVAFYPVLAVCLALRVLKYLTNVYSTKAVLWGTGGFVLWALLAVLVAGILFHREFIPGTYYFWKTVGPLLSELFLLGFDLFIAYALVTGWTSAYTGKQKFATILVTLSAISAVVGFVGLRISSAANLAGFAALAFLLFIGGVSTLPKSTEAKPVSALEDTDREMPDRVPDHSKEGLARSPTGRRRGWDDGPAL